MPNFTTSCSSAWSVVTYVVHKVNLQLREYDPTTLVASTVASTAAISAGLVTFPVVAGVFSAVHFARKAYQNATKDNIVALLATIPVEVKIPGVGKSGPQIKADLKEGKREARKAKAEMYAKVSEKYQQWRQYPALPEEGLSFTEIAARFKNIGKHVENFKLTKIFYPENLL